MTNEANQGTMSIGNLSDESVVRKTGCNLGADGLRVGGARISIDIAGYPTRAGSGRSRGRGAGPRGMPAVVQALLDGGAELSVRPTCTNLSYGVDGESSHDRHA